MLIKIISSFLCSLILCHSLFATTEAEMEGLPEEKLEMIEKEDSKTQTRTPTREQTQIGGDWSGKLDLGAMKLTLVVRVLKIETGTGGWKATLDCLEQELKDYPVDLFAQAGNDVRFEIKALKITFKGKINGNKDEIEGTFKQYGTPLPLILKRGIATVEKPNRPQEPKRPYPYQEIEVSYRHPAGHTLAGTLTLPSSGTKPFPVVLLITGSGPQDRDETIFGHKPFLILADHLTRKGIACLRVDDRSVGKSTGKFDDATSEDFATDVMAGIEFLKTHPAINPRQIGLLGHSEGGLIAPMVAAKSTDVAFIVMLAGPGVKGEDILIKQGELKLRAIGTSEEKIAFDRKMREASFEILKNEPDLKRAEQKLREAAKKLEAEELRTDKSGKKVPGSLTDAQVEAFIELINTKWFRYFLTYDPRTALRKVKIPVLALNGENDVQVSFQQSLPEIERALEEAGNKTYTIIKLQKLNHLFQTSKTGAIEEYAQIEETIAPRVLDLISDWISARTSSHTSAYTLPEYAPFAE